MIVVALIVAVVAVIALVSFMAGWTLRGGYEVTRREGYIDFTGAHRGR